MAKASAPSGITLYGALNSGHAYKPRLFLLLAGIGHDYRPIDISVPRDRRPAEFRAVSRFGEVPVLLHGGQTLVQSNAILLHLARHFRRFGAQDNAGLDEVTLWLFWEANRIGRSYPNLRHCKLFDKTADSGLVAWFERTAQADLDRLNEQLAGRDFILGDFTVADISCAAYLLFADYAAIGIARWPNVAAWLDRIRALPGWRHPHEVMGKETVDV